MNVSSLIPPLDEFGLPAPPWVFVVLLNVTLVLHFLALGYVVLASLLQVFWSAAAREGNTAAWMLRRTEGPLPICLSFTITLGVAPLLFVQVLFQPFFYTANILIGFQWFGIIFVLLSVFYMIYLLYGGRFMGWAIPRPLAVAGRGLIFLGILYILATHTVNALTVLHPERWRAIQAAGGNFLQLDSPVLWPRLLHNFLALSIVGAVWMIALGWRSARVEATEAGRENGRRLAKLGGMLATLGIFVQIFVGLWLLMAEGSDIIHMLFGGSLGSVLWMIALAATIGLLVIAVMAMSLRPSRGLLWAAWGVLFVLLAGMVAGREAVRAARLGLHEFTLGGWTLNLQLSSLVLFLSMFVAMLLILALMLRWTYAALATKDKA